eukprot:358393-Chlamydomonas_euryale.AAC.2
MQAAHAQERGELSAQHADALAALQAELHDAVEAADARCGCFQCGAARVRLDWTCVCVCVWVCGCGGGGVIFETLLLTTETTLRHCSVVRATFVRLPCNGLGRLGNRLTLRWLRAMAAHQT